MGDERRIEVKGWAVGAVIALVAVVLATVGFESMPPECR